jgi:hypothetical protein
MTKAAMVIVVMAGGAMTGLVAPEARAQQTNRAGPAASQRDQGRAVGPEIETVPGLTERLDQSAEPDRTPAATRDDRGFVWPSTPLPSVTLPDTSASTSAVTPTTTTQSTATQVPAQPGAPHIPKVEIPEIQVFAPPPAPAVRIIPPSRAPVFAPTSSFPSVSIPSASP